MNTPLEPFPIPYPDGDWMSEEEFAEWSKTPGRFAALEDWLSRAECGENIPVPPELHRALKVAITRRETARALRRVDAKLAVLSDAIVAADESITPEALQLRCRQLMTDVTDALLEVPEPQRTKFLSSMLPLREQLRTMK